MPILTPDYPLYDSVSQEQAIDKKRMSTDRKAFERHGIPIDFPVTDFYMRVDMLL